jgi:hypothetical protein
MRRGVAIPSGGTHQTQLIDSLSDGQRAFVRAYVMSGGNAAFARQASGLSAHASTFLRSATISAAIRAEQAAVISGELASIAIGTLRDIMRDSQARNSDRVAAARLSLEAARWIGRAAPQDTNTANKPIAEMTAAELDSLISDTQRALQAVRNESRTIDATAVTVQSTQQA